MATQSWIRRLFARSPRPARRTRLGVEAFEDRTVPATIRLPALTDAALRAAITQSNATPEADTIVFGTERFRQPLIGESDPNVVYLNTPLPTITGTVTIVGEINYEIALYDRGFTVSANGKSRAFEVGPTGFLTIDNLVVADGNAGLGDGGAILNRGLLTVKNSLITRSQAANGGGIASTLAVSVVDSFVADNKALLAGGGLYATGLAALVVGSDVSRNVAVTAGGGMATAAANVTVSRTLLGRNAVNGPNGTPVIDPIAGPLPLPGDAPAVSGGGLAVYGGSVRVEDSTVSGNVVRGGFGARGANGAWVSDFSKGAPDYLNGQQGGTGGVGVPGGAGGNARGGGIAVEAGSLTVVGSTLDNNGVYGGGGSAGGNGGKGGRGQHAVDIVPDYLLGVVLGPPGWGGPGGTGGAGGAGGAGGFGLGGGVAVGLQADQVTVTNTTVADNTAVGGPGADGGNAGDGGDGGNGGVTYGKGFGHPATGPQQPGGFGGFGGNGGNAGAAGGASGGGVYIEPTVIPRTMTNVTVAGNRVLRGTDGARPGAAGVGGFQGDRVLSGNYPFTNSWYERVNGVFVLRRQTIGGVAGITSTPRAATGGGVGYYVFEALPVWPAATWFPLTLTNTLVAANTYTAGTAAGPDNLFGALVTPAASRGNLIGADATSRPDLPGLEPAYRTGGLTNGVRRNQLGVADAKLLPLGNYGGPTRTVPLAEGSPARNAGNTDAAEDAGLTTDQRGAGRVRASGRVDIGAYEVQAPTVTAAVPAVVGDEGSAAANTLAVALDPANTSAVVLVSLGAVARNPDGTWGWSHTPADGPAGPTTVTVNVNDADQVGTTAFTLAVRNVRPTITAFSVPATAILGPAVDLSATATDPAGAADPLTYTWTVTRPDGTNFTLTGASPSFTPTAGGGWGVALTVDDGDGGTAVRVATLDVRPPIRLSNAAVAENRPAGTAVGTLSSTDPVVGAATRYTLADDAGGRFAVSGNRLVTTGPLDHEAAAGHTVVVRAEFAGGMVAEQALAVAVTDGPDVTGFRANRGLVQRSLVRHLDVTLDSAAAAAALTGAGRVRLVKRDLNGNNPVVVALPAGAVTVAGAVLTVDFGPNGLGGNRNSNAADGYYTLQFDLDGDGGFEADRRFYRLLGDTNGDRKVDAADLDAVDRAIADRVYQLDLDVNGDGVVNWTDRLLVARQVNLGRRLAAGLPLDG